MRSDSADSDAPGGTTDAPADTGATGSDLAGETSADSAGSDKGDLAASDTSGADGAGAEPATDGSLSDSQDGQGHNGPVCGALVNASAAITPTQITSFSHNFQGGVVADGTYVLTSAEETIGISLTPTMFRRTFRVSDAGSVFEWVIQDIGSPPDEHLAGALSISGTTLVMSDTCVPINLVYPYDAQGTNLRCTSFSVR